MLKENGPRGGLKTASVKDTFAVFTSVALPTLGKGVIIRRPLMVGLAERLSLDDRAVKRLQRLRKKYGDGPLLLAVPWRRQAVLLSAPHVHRVLNGAPEPFAPASAEKRAALAHFEPDVSLISEGEERRDRRGFNEEVLESGCRVHRLAASFLEVVDQEAQRLLAQAGAELDWSEFKKVWDGIVRRVVLGDGARDDRELTEMLDRLRAAGNWAFLHPGRKKLRHKFLERVRTHLDRADEGSLSGVIAATSQTEITSPAHQVAHYLFAFDPGGMATFRTLALLATHPRQQQRVREEIAAAGREGRSDLSYSRACYLEALRLWPTTPAVFRETTEDVDWDGGVMPKNTNILIFAPFFHRDDENLSYAHTFSPEIWLERPPGGGWPLIPFSAGPGECPARHLVPMLGSAMVAAILSARAIALDRPGRLDPEQPLPGTLDNYTLRFGLSPLE